MFFGSNDNKLICTLVNDYNINDKKSNNIVNFIDNKDIINLVQNKEMYDIIKRISETNETNAAIFNTNMKEKIDTINFYYQNSDILDLCIDLNKKDNYLTLGNFFNCLKIRNEENKSFEKIILAHFEEIDKFKDEIKNEDTIIYLFFTKESAKHFSFEDKYQNYHNNYYIKVYFGYCGKIFKYLKKLTRDIYSYFNIKYTHESDINEYLSDSN